MRPALVELASRRAARSRTRCRGDIGSGERPDPALGFGNYLRPARRRDRSAPARAQWRCAASRSAVSSRCATPRRVRTRHVARARFVAGAGLEAEPATGAVAGAAVDVGAGVCRTSPMRVWPEVRASFPTWSARLGFFVRQGLRAARAPMIPSLMAERVRRAQQTRLRAGLRAHHGADARAHRRGAARSRRAGREHAVVLHSDSRRRMQTSSRAPAISASLTQPSKFARRRRRVRSCP